MALHYEGMTTGEYKAIVIEHFRSGRATDAAWQAMARLVLEDAENPGPLADEGAEIINVEIWGERVECPQCGAMCIPDGSWCYSCDDWRTPDNRRLVSDGLE